METLKKEAASGENILSIQFFATHRVSSDGMQGVATNTVIPNTQNFELIRVEEFLRTHAQETPNVYYLVFFAYECKADVTGQVQWTRHDTGLIPRQLMNFTMVFEQDQFGVSVDQSFSQRLTQLFLRSFDFEYGTLVVP
jgi:hypothetical protein